MGESVGSCPVSQEEQSVEEYFNKLCPYFMAIGMTYDEFWYDTPRKALMFLKAHKIRQKQDNERLWLQGYYNFVAFGTVLANAFAKKGTPPTPYMKKPLNIDPNSEDTSQEQRNERLLGLKEVLIAMSKKGGSNNG